MRNKPLNKIRTLSQLLIFSGSVNIMMLALLIYWNLKERPPTPICEKKPTYKEYNFSSEKSELINYLVKLKYENLLTLLKNKSPVDYDLTLRDLVLGCLSDLHELDVSRALSLGQKETKFKLINYLDENRTNQKIKIYSNITDADFLTVEKFIQTEKWPFTSKGIFSRLKQVSSEDKHLKYAFFISPEFMSVELLLKRSNNSIEKEEILNLLLEGSWETLSNFFEKQRLTQDLSEEARRRFLLSYIEQGSAKAASIFLKTDSKYALKKLDDAHIIDILKLAKERTPYAARFALDSLVSPRAKEVCQEAAYRLYEFVGEEKPKEFIKDRAMTRFANFKEVEHSEISTTKESVVSDFFCNLKPWKRAYTVMEGDSLWKISRMFKVDIQELKTRNQLTKDSLQPGTMIMVP